MKSQAILPAPRRKIIQEKSQHRYSSCRNKRFTESCWKVGGVVLSEYVYDNSKHCKNFSRIFNSTIPLESVWSGHKLESPGRKCEEYCLMLPHQVDSVNICGLACLLAIWSLSIVLLDKQNVNNTFSWIRRLDKFATFFWMYFLYGKQEKIHITSSEGNECNISSNIEEFEIKIRTWWKWWTWRISKWNFKWNNEFSTYLELQDAISYPKTIEMKG